MNKLLWLLLGPGRIAARESANLNKVKHSQLSYYKRLGYGIRV